MSQAPEASSAEGPGDFLRESTQSGGALQDEAMKQIMTFLYGMEERLQARLDRHEENITDLQRAQSSLTYRLESYVTMRSSRESSPISSRIDPVQDKPDSDDNSSDDFRTHASTRMIRTRRASSPSALVPKVVSQPNSTVDELSAPVQTLPANANNMFSEQPETVSVSGGNKVIDVELDGRRINIHRRRDSFTAKALPNTPFRPLTLPKSSVSSSQSTPLTDSNPSGVRFSTNESPPEPDSSPNPFDPSGDLAALGAILDNSSHFRSPGKSAKDDYIGRQTIQLDKYTTSYQPTYYKPEPEHNIYLASLTLAAVIRFVDEVFEYQYRHGIRLRVGALIKTNVAQELIDRLEGLTLPVLLTLPTQLVFKALQLEICPSTSYEFYHRMESTIKFIIAVPNRGYRPSPGDFKPFYMALLNFRKQFQRAYDILSAYADTVVIPPFNTKRFGLIKLFLDKIPFDYGYRLHQSDLEHRLTSKEISHIHQYLKVFYEHVTLHYETFRQVRIMGQHFGGSEYASGDNLHRRPTVQFQRPHQSSHRLHAIHAETFAPPESDDPRGDGNAYVFDDPVTSDMDWYGSQVDAAAQHEEYLSYTNGIIHDDGEEEFIEHQLDAQESYSPQEEDVSDHADEDLLPSNTPHVSDNPLPFSAMRAPATELNALPASSHNRMAPTPPKPYLSNKGKPINAAQRAATAPGKAACRAAAMSPDGKCPKLSSGSECSYNHDKLVLRDEYHRIVRSLASSPFASSSPSHFPSEGRVSSSNLRSSKPMFQGHRRPPPPPRGSGPSQQSGNNPRYSSTH